MYTNNQNISSYNQELQTITKHKWDKNSLPLVSISCTAYNHEQYIREAIDGFLIQKTNFLVEIIIHDDASTDGTAEIIKEYEGNFPQLIFPIYQKENQYSKGVKVSPTFNWPRARGKYIALCEGDDYWTDPYKLQRQVDFLEANEEYVLCCHDYSEIRQSEYFKIKHPKLSKRNVGNSDLKISLNNMFSPFIIKTLTCVFRRSAIDFDFIKKNNKGFKDIVLFAMLLRNGPGICLNQDMGVYRVSESGVWSMVDKETQTLNNTLAFCVISKMFNHRDLYFRKRVERNLLFGYEILLNKESLTFFEKVKEMLNLFLETCSFFSFIALLKAVKK